MNLKRLSVGALLIAGILSVIPMIATPAFADGSGAGTITCPLTFSVHASTTGTIPCTLTYSGADGTTITFGTSCASPGPLFCSGWTIGAPTPGSFTSTAGAGPFTQSVSFPVTAPATCSGAGPSPCSISVQITASGGGLATIGGGTIVAVATILISTPEFGVAAVAVAVGLVGLLTLRRRAVISPAVPV